MNKATRMIPVLALAGVLAGCSTIMDGLPKQAGAAENPGVFVAMIGDVKAERLNDPFIRAGLEALDAKDLQAASKAFNRALKFEPTDANLHFLNALTYHLQAAEGDSSMLDMAKVGYDLALRYDASNFWAAYQLGRISISEQRYREAQDAFAYALLYDENNPDILRALSAASYYAQDLDTALGAIEKASELRPGDADIAYDSALINAAAGRGDIAQAELAAYTGQAGAAKSFRKDHLASRVRDWGKFHRKTPGLQLAQTTKDILGDDATKDSSAKSSSGSDDTDSAVVKADKAKVKADKAKVKADFKSMVLVDVIIIRSEERIATSKGLNLLSGLSSTLSGTLWSLTATRNVNSAAANTRTKVFTIAPSFNISASYSLNIFNDNFDKNEVLARPTLVALNNKKSEFFSGAILHVELTGSAGSQGAVQSVPIGIKLDVTPKFHEVDEVELKVVASRAFIESRASNAGFNNFTQVTSTKVTANVTMKFGDTLVLSGLSEKETENLRDGVPFLQDIPGIQYLFSDVNTLDFTKSVLILLTPRKPRFTYEDGSVKIDPQNPADADIDQAYLEELKNSTEWRKPSSNLDAVFWHLKDAKYFKLFRSGDVRLEKWTYPDRIERMTRRAIQFLYY